MTCSLTARTLIKVQIPERVLFTQLNSLRMQASRSYVADLCTSTPQAQALLPFFNLQQKKINENFLFDCVLCCMILYPHCECFSSSEVNSACWMSVSWPPDPARVLASKTLRHCEIAFFALRLVFCPRTCTIPKPLHKRCYL